MRASWWTAVQAVIGLPLAFGVNLVVARTLGPHGYGLVASYIAAYALILAVLNGGISDATIQWGAAAHARGDRAQLLEICRRCAGFHILVEGPLGAIAAAVMLRNESAWVQIVGAASVAVTMVVGTTVVLMTAMSMNAPLAKLNLVVGVALQLSVVTAAVQTHAAGPTWVARVAVSALVPIGALVIAPRDILRASFSPLLPHRWPDGFAGYSVRTLIAGLVASLVFSRSEVLVLDGYGKAAAAGVFALAAGLAGQITAPVDAMLGPLIPAAASLVAVGRERAAHAILRGMRLSGLITMPILATTVPAVAVLTPVIYGDRFGVTGALFISLGVVSCLQSVLHPVTAFLAALRRPLLVLGINGAALAVDLILVLILAPVIGASGAVVGNSAGQLVSLAAASWVLRRHLQVGVRASAEALLPFALASAWVTCIATAGVIARNETVNIATATLLAVALALVGSLAVIRTCGGLVTEQDLAAVDAGFPRGAQLRSRLARRLGVVRTAEG